MNYIYVKSRHSKRMSKSEYNVIKFLLDELGVEYESDGTMTLNYSTITCGGKPVYFPEYYSSLDTIPKEKMLFKPISNERHTNSIIGMFEDEKLIKYDSLEITDFQTDSGKTRYRGHAIYHKNIIKHSTINSAPNVPIAKISILVKLLNKEAYNTYKPLITEYISYIKNKKRGNYEKI